MIDTSANVREHCSAAGLTGRIQSALAAIAPESQTLTVAQLAPLDQFHLRGILANSELEPCRRDRAIDARARSRLRHQRASTLSRRPLRLQGDRRRPQSRLH